MRALSISGLLFLLWMLAVHNLEQFHRTLALSPLAIGLPLTVAMAVLLIPSLRRLSLFSLVAASGAMLLALKAWLAGPGEGIDIPVAVTELTVMAVTLLLASRFGRSLDSLRNSLAGIVLSHVHERSLPFETGQTEIYREIRRARLHGRPLALMVVAPTNADSVAVRDRIAEEIARNMARDYLTARLAGLLSSGMTGCEIITQRDGRFIVLLPETTRDAAAATVARLGNAAKEELGVELEFGYSLFPDEEVSFVGLLEHAEENVRRTRPHALRGAVRGRGHDGMGRQPRRAAGEILRHSARQHVQTARPSAHDGDATEGQDAHADPERIAATEQG